MPSLETYRKKRDFSKTREPNGGPRRRASKTARHAPSYVIQKHAARRLHYDFRLELDGVLLSWAVPKGPSLDPSVKRLAQETEPHPLEYGGFEGTIPKGEYGGGTVMVWDRGSWEAEGDARAAYQKGHLQFTLQGDKLRGRWHLVRTRAGDGKAQKSWLLFKARDELAREDGKSEIVDELPNSALTGRDLEQIAAGKAARVAAKVKTEARNVKPRTRTPKKSSAPLRRAEPELATLVDAAPEGQRWLHEIKLDGYRILAHVNGSDVHLLTRNGKDWTDRMPTLEAALQRLGLDQAVIDGELVALDERGVSIFQQLQNSLNADQDSALVFFAFDLLFEAGEDLRMKPLLERKERLKALLGSAEAEASRTVRLSEHVLGSGPEFFAQACKLGLEGIISKRADSAYHAGRGRDWLKVKCSQRQEFVVVGYSEPGGSRSHLGALLLAAERDGALSYAGRVGTGFSDASLREIHRRLVPLEVSQPPLENPPKGADARDVHWVEPILVAEVAFTNFTDEGHLRHPTFQGLRDDKPAAGVRVERPVAAEAAVASAESADSEGPAKPAKKAAKKPEKPAKTAKAEKRLSADYPLTNPSKVLYPDCGVTKRELIAYYELVAERMLPHVANRPLTLVRCPNGVGKPCFFQKHPGGGTPDALRSISIREKEGKAPYSVIDDVMGLFGLVQLGALEIHTWGSRADDFERPDLLVFDLDPDEGLDFSEVITAAKRLREIFDAAKMESFVKTTGGKGLHVCIPFEPDLDWDPIKDFAGRVAEALAQHYPNRYLATQSKAKRKGKIFIDFLRNGRGATFIAPYSTRARDGAPIAVPLEWDELDGYSAAQPFTVRNIADRLRGQKADPFARMATIRQRLRPQAVGD